MLMKYFLMLSLLFISSCSQLSYLTEQGISQLKLQWSGIDNKEMLKDPAISAETKRKILLIEDYKKFFYEYFNKDTTSIYSKTSMLKQDAVTYLLIASPHSTIETHKFSFPFFGEFPYLGFFSKQSASSYSQKLSNQGLVTWIRPVYAYSTLGYFEDRILSSFFYYDDLDLAELIFHELFHTIFFIKDDVDLNENLANYFGKELARLYFKDDPRLKAFEMSSRQSSLVANKVVELIKVLEAKLLVEGSALANDEADRRVSHFLQDTFYPQMKSFCQQEQITEKDCLINTTWNQARFAAFLTYEEEQDLISDLQKKLNLGINEYYLWLNQEYKDFKNKKLDSFTEYLREKAI